MKRRVVVTGLGIIAPTTNNKEELWQMISQGKSMIGNLTRFESGSLPCRLAGEANYFEADDYIDRKMSRTMDRSAQLAVGAAQLAVRDAELNLGNENLSRIGVFEGTSLGPLNCTLHNHRAYLNEGCRRANPSMLVSSMMGAGSGFIALTLGIHGPSLTISDGSASSAYAIGYGYRNIQGGYIDVAVSGGAEAPLSEEVFSAFCCARLLSPRNDDPQHAIRPFDRERNGFVLSEGAAFLILEELSHARARNARVYAEIVGFGETTDAFHPTSPDPTGAWITQAMKHALEESETCPDEVQYINAHGTATRANDCVETLAIKQAFGEHAMRLQVSSTKPITGHLLGACAAVEASITLLAMERRFLPPTRNLTHPDDGCDLDYVPAIGRTQDIQVAMSNSYSFGGRNASLLFKTFSDN